LAKYYREHGMPQEAVKAQRKVMLSAPSVRAFKTLRDSLREELNKAEL
jgi:hypothetical protein